MRTKIALGLALALGMTTAACRQREDRDAGMTGEGTTTEQQAAAGGDQKFTETGTVSNASQDKITLRSQGGEDLELEVKPETNIMQNGQKVAASAVQEGSQVRASYVIRGNDKVAERIDVVSQGSGTKAPAGQAPGQMPHDTDAPDQMPRNP